MRSSIALARRTPPTISCRPRCRRATRRRDCEAGCRPGLERLTRPLCYSNPMLPRYIPHYTVEDYRQWEGKWELWTGLPVAMSPSSDRQHQRIGVRLLERLSHALKATGCQHCEVLYAIDWIAADKSEFSWRVRDSARAGGAFRLRSFTEPTTASSARIWPAPARFGSAPRASWTWL